MTCTRCSTAYPRVALTIVNEEAVCPLCLAVQAEEQAKHQVLQRADAPPSDHGLTVVDLPRGMAGRLAARERSRT